MKTPINKKLKDLMMPSLYLVFVLVMSFLAYKIVNKNYFYSIFVDGESMMPTLNETARESGKYIYDAEFGYVDPSKSALSLLKRYDIVITYFPDDYGSDGKLKENVYYKVKRIIACPGDRFKIYNNVVSYYENGEWVDAELPFEHKPSANKNIDAYADVPLGENEYWLVGDNWGNSTDSKQKGAINIKLIKGVLVAIEGTCTVDTSKKIDQCSDYVYYKTPRYFI